MADEHSCPVDDCGASFPTPTALGGHVGQHTKSARRAKELDLNALGAKPPCFTSQSDWEYSARQLQIEFPNRPITRDFVLRESCRVCSLMYQQLAQRFEICRPPAGAPTPQVRAAKGIDDLADDPQVSQ